MTKTCPECESSNLRWYLGKRPPIDVVEGRLRTNEISIIAYLACEECSETITIINEVDIEKVLNKDNPCS